MKEYSIKTVDGNRYDFRTADDYIQNQLRGLTEMGKLLAISLGSHTDKFFNIDNIVSVTEKDCDK